ncbi:ABC transporter ATP-binding protein [Desulfurivibrio alkaliphilus]|uniref:ABC transporter related protein n=1 Tax=Desulfurivibrio alkaliphilus (strain DSM 19089 / UNIQEM U267 / AHT2) TaxID=589865 RepID=D6Z3G2_DESAT|nr:ABC transporter ATP-binding protein [Desulfurivibrio alkaliphilus]ADH86087.1 ABC transporter related protein [Desulfurivibrio alkaliphilus AHT 2]
MTVNEKPNTPILEVSGLSKRFGAHQAVKDLDLTVGAGEIFGFLGPNGAGKTTTIRMLVGLLKPDDGSVRIMGRDLAADPAWGKSHTGYIPDRPFLYEKLTGQEFLQFMAGLYRLPPETFQRNAPRLLRLFDLEQWQDHLVESYSHGMKQKLIITAAFMLEPPLIVVDEPMVGLDPKSARLVKEIFKQHAAAGNTVFLSTHSLEVAQELCHRIGIIVNGRLKALGDMEQLRAQARGQKGDLEDIFLELTGSHELQAVIGALQDQ